MDDGRTRRTRLVAWLCAFACWLAGGTTIPASAEPNLLAHAAGDALWVASVVNRPPDGPPGLPPAVPGWSSTATAEPVRQTQVLVRPIAPHQPWRLLTVIPGRATSLAVRQSQLAVLLADGQWMTVWPDGSATGQRLPAGGRVCVLGDDGHDLWAIGQVCGGLAAATADLARAVEATTRPNGLFPTAPATRPAAVPPPPVAPADWASRPPVPLVVFRQTDGRWTAVAELPPVAVHAVRSADDLSLAVIGRVPTLAYRTADRVVHTIQWQEADGGTSAGRWEPASRPETDPVAADFELLPDAAGNRPVLWTTTGSTDPGRLHLPGGESGGGVEPGPPDVRPLRWPGPPPLEGTPTATVAGGYVRLIGRANAKVWEQRYDLAGAAVGTPAVVFVPPDPVSPAVLWLQGLLLASLAFAIGTSVFRQVTPGSAATVTLGGAVGDEDVNHQGTVTGPVPAPLATRATAGVIDLLPLLAGVLVALVVASHHPDDPAPPAAVWAVVVGAVIYLAHTTALEGLTARSAGKWVTGLRVATPDGGRPAPWQLVARNLLRVLDPLVWIVLSPMRQRTADVLAGTVVVRDVTPAVAPSSSSPPPEDQP